MGFPDGFFDNEAVGLLVRFVGVMASMLPMDLAAFQAAAGGCGEDGVPTK